MRKQVRFIVEKICLCGCKGKFLQYNTYKGYKTGHSQKITRKLMIGDKAPGWKGGEVYKREYVFIYSPKHPHNDGGYVKRSRLTVEQNLGRYLRTSEIVHHINGIKDDDRIENLIVITRAVHTIYHKSLPKGKWAFKFDHCILCGTKTIPHHSHGKCLNCR